MTSFRDLTSGGKVSVTKAFLGALDDSRDAFDVYKDYYQRYTLLDSDYNLSALSRFSGSERDRILRELYRVNEPWSDPDWMTFWSPHDVNRVSDLVDAETVVYITSSGKSLPSDATKDWIRFKMSDIEVFHDYRATSFLPSALEGCDAKPKRTIFFLLACFGQERRLYRLNAPLGAWIDRQFSVVGMPFERTRTSVIPEEGGCVDFLDSLCLLLASESIDPEEPRLRIEHPNDFLHVSEMQVLEHLDARITGGLQRPFIIVAFTRNPNKVTFRNKAHRQRCQAKRRGAFFTLAVISRVPSDRPFSERVPDPLDCDVVCVFSQVNICLLADDWKKSVIERHFSTRGFKETLQNRELTRLGGFAKKLSPGELQEALDKAESSRRQKNKRPQKRKKCRCSVCSVQTAYDDNMSKIGPERLCSTKYTISELLRITNIPFPEDRLEKIVELSVAAMDIESKTQLTSMITPRPGPCVEYAEVDQAVLEGHVKKIQTPIMVAHTDALTLGSTWSLTSEGDDFECTFKLMSDYWRRVIERREECVRLKRELAGPAFEVIQEYKSKFYEYYNSKATELRSWAEDSHQEALLELERSHDGSQPELDAMKNNLIHQHTELTSKLPTAKGVEKAWRATLFGMLDFQLGELVHSYTIFSFCG